jgi:hypothetical protein
LGGEALDHRGESRRDGALICRGALAAGPQQDSVDGDALYFRQFGEQLMVDVTEKVGDGRICEDGFCLAASAGQDGESESVCLRYAGEPKRRLADTGFTLDDEP